MGEIAAQRGSQQRRDHAIQLSVALGQANWRFCLSVDLKSAAGMAGRVRALGRSTICIA